MKRFVCITAAFIFAFATGLAASAVTMYARDGRTIDVAEDEVEAYTAVGWYADPFVTVYALDGRSLSVPGAQVEDYIKVGWYRELPTVTLYAEDGRTTDVSYPLVEAYTKVGWYTEPFVTLYTYDGERSIKVTQSRVAAHTAVGWYELSALPTVTLYALDGRTIEIPFIYTDEYRAVGWYKYDEIPKVTLYAWGGKEIRVAEFETASYIEKGWAREPFPEKVMIDAPYINQRKRYPNGCEAVTAVMALQYMGQKVTPDIFISRYLDMGTAPYKVSGKWYGCDPRQQYPGDPRNMTGWGCYPEVIKKAADKMALPGIRTEILYGTSMEELCRSYIDKGIPVMCWATIDMEKPYLCSTWTIEGTDRIHEWIAPFHCLLLVGYDNDNYYFNDPWRAKNTAYPKASVEYAYGQLGSMAMVVTLEK